MMDVYTSGLGSFHYNLTQYVLIKPTVPDYCIMFYANIQRQLRRVL